LASFLPSKIRDTAGIGTGVQGRNDLAVTPRGARDIGLQEDARLREPPRRAFALADQLLALSSVAHRPARSDSCSVRDTMRAYPRRNSAEPATACEAGRSTATCGRCISCVVNARCQAHLMQSRLPKRHGESPFRDIQAAASLQNLPIPDSCSAAKISDAVGTLITERPPHRTHVRLSRIRLLPGIDAARATCGGRPGRNDHRLSGQSREADRGPETAGDGEHSPHVR
jgi:hypothetical protein